MRLIENDSYKFTNKFIESLNESSSEDNAKDIAQDIIDNFESITSKPISYIFDSNGTMIQKRVEKTSESIINYCKEKYNCDITKERSDVLYILDELLQDYTLDNDSEDGEESIEECSLKENSTEDYWDAKEIIRDGFLSLLKFNFGTDFKGNNYIITNDAYDMKRFYAKDDEEAKKIYNEYKAKKESVEECDLKEADGDSTFKLALNLNNEAFGDGDSIDDAFKGVSKILKDVAGNLEYTDKKAILDINGNTIGYYGFGYEGVVDSLDESVEGIEGFNNNAKDVTDEFKNIKAFNENFEPIRIIKDQNHYYIFKSNATKYTDYINNTDSKDYIEGWLYGAVQANNKIITSK